MSVEAEYGTVKATGSCTSFCRTYTGDGVEIEVEYPDLGAWHSRNATCTMTVVIADDDWDAIVAFLAAARDKHDTGDDA